VTGPARIVLIDDGWIVISRLRELIGQNSDLVVVAACRCADGAMAAIQQYRPQVVVLDVRLPDRDGFELIRDIAAISEAKVIVFTAALRKAKVLSALRSGAEAVVFKNQPASMLISCVRKVLAGEPREARHISTPEQPKAAVRSGVEALSAREREVAQWAATGACNKEIAWELGISEGTVKLHLFHAYRKLRVGNRVGLLLALGRAAEKLKIVGTTFIWSNFRLYCARTQNTHKIAPVVVPPSEMLDGSAPAEISNGATTKTSTTGRITTPVNWEDAMSNFTTASRLGGVLIAAMFFAPGIARAAPHFNTVGTPTSLRVVTLP